MSHLLQQPVSESPACDGYAVDEVRLLDPLDDARWTAFVHSAPNASIFHHPAWLSLLHEQYRYPLVCCCLVDEHQQIRTGVPLAFVRSRLTGRRLVALPFADACPPLTLGGGEDARLRVALETLCQQSGAERLQVRGAVCGVDGVGPRYHRHLIDLTRGVASVRMGFTRRSVMQGARRALRAGVKIEQRTDPGALCDYYRLHLATRQRQGMPTQPRSFMLRFSALFERGLGFVMLAKLGGRPVAGAVFLVFDGTITYKYGASEARFLDRRPNNLLFVEAIEHACAAQMHTLDLGRTDLGHESLRTFKLTLGAREELLAYCELGRGDRSRGLRPPSSTVQAVIRRAPPLVSRGVGELLYRHVG